ncbi:hypothetical protein [Sphingomonas sp. M1-B02]|uniref:hypothetical protein n=1 Tax=Sphingomonas sp. M1-B02 TaxID=3114300 RepID=UPI00223F1F1D|nr:hypothetical protein [Sphingomonas sp. S6-11]UZK65510.1 hypothetical protein OKW87_13480 [Sphingomonas sp. S6-11]
MRRAARPACLATGAIALALLAPPPLVSAARTPAAQQVPAPPLAPDYATITTRVAAAKLVRKRLLVRIHFFPVELGGPKGRTNIGYVTPEAALSHAQLIEMLAIYIERDLIDHLEVVPEYKGESIIPTRIRMIAHHSRSAERHERMIDVWDCDFCAPFEPLPEPDGREAVRA